MHIYIENFHVVLYLTLLSLHFYNTPIVNNHKIIIYCVVVNGRVLHLKSTERYHC